MAIDNISTAEITTEILQITGYTSSALAPWASDANLVVKLNLAAHRIPQKIRQVAQALGFQGRISMPMWFTTIDSTDSAGTGNFVVSASTATGHLPVDADMVHSVIDLTDNRLIPVIESSNETWYEKLRRGQPGPTKYIHITGMAGGTEQAFRLLPDVAAGVTPSMRLEYYRIPTDLASGGSSFPDADYRFHYLWVLIGVLEILRPDTPNYERYLQLEKEMLIEMAETARAA